MIFGKMISYVAFKHEKVTATCNSPLWDKQKNIFSLINATSYGCKRFERWPNDDNIIMPNSTFTVEIKSENECINRNASTIMKTS